MTKNTKFVQVQPLGGFSQALSYGVPKSLEKNIKVGSLVRISVGSRRLNGIVTSFSQAEATHHYKLKDVSSIVQKDPVLNFELFLKEEGILSEDKEREIKEGFKQEIQNSFEIAQNENVIESSEDKEEEDVFQPHNQQVIPANSSEKEIRFIDAIREGLIQSMEKYPELVLMGQDIAEYGGAFKVTEGLVDLYGKDRVRNTPLCESAIVGAGLGLSISGMKAMVEMQFADFVTCGFNQIVNNLAKIYWRWGQNVDVVVRMPTGAGTGAGPFH